ncbi:glycoside hydrolase family 30 beta sandwich domain-containing protein [Neobacillus sp. PS3-34]|uniref:glycoside hydrolase family 30 protein n=1 Tax=Neobacillus sp. PS3-34 TaxID=3070678 RepID=UPI0027DF465A|nr:glycoside hydrolase family 30 beta sandwich domain-containing protein [Neobacillus sp. PS3-34]WML49072.1 glycoside hydrolase family 30 beta sandwich domain-containing protein [Neobacillus sp. PS3-34]
MDGFGASFTDSSAYLIHQVLEKEQRTDLMEKLFHPEKGIGLSVLRNPMGASDFAREMYSYNDIPEGETDFQLEQFTVAHDMEDIIPLSKEALALNPDIKLMASPWSAPAWMKTSGSMIGGELKEECYEVYANYFTKYILAYTEQGLPIYAITPQNEALFVPGHYPGMLMLPEWQSDFIKNYLKPNFLKHKLDTKILCYDHNWDRPDYPLSVFDDAGDAVDGVAWHWYGGKPVAQHQVHMAYPDKEVHFTEGSGGEWIPAFEPAFSNVLRTGIEILRNDSKSFVLWNMALDEENGPVVPGFGRSTCRGVVTVDQQTKDLTYTLDYYALAHFSKFVRPKARRIASSSDKVIRSVAFKNTDGSIVTILFNDSEEMKTVQLQQQGNEILHCHLAAKSAMTILKK